MHASRTESISRIEATEDHSALLEKNHCVCIGRTKSLRIRYQTGDVVVDDSEQLRAADGLGHEEHARAGTQTHAALTQVLEEGVTEENDLGDGSG